MDKLRSMTSKLSLPSMPSSAGAKLSKAFKFDKQHNVLSRKERGDPFANGPIFEEKSMDKPHLILHTISGFFCFLAVCTIGAVAGFQAKWTGVSGGTGFVLFLTIVSFLLTSFLTITPIVYDRWDKLKRPAQFLAVTRPTLILHAFGTGVMLLSSFIVTISAWTAKGCKNADNDPHASLGAEFKDGLKQWCTTKKASAIFDWFSFAAWAVLLVLSVLKFRRERKREPGFIPPSSDGISYSNVNAHIPAADDPYADKHEVAPQDTGYARYSYSGARDAGDEAFGRPSIDGYGFERVSTAAVPASGRTSTIQHAHDEASRTMQLAYSDPYAQIKQSLMGDQQQGPPSYVTPQYTQYAQYAQNIPQPPGYGRAPSYQ